MSNVKLMGKLASVEYGDDDTTQAIQLLAANEATPSEYAEWMKGRDEYRDAAASAAAQQNAGAIRVKASPKGGVSLYVNSRMPTTLYANQWRRVLGMAKEIEAFISANTDSLSFPDDSAAKKAKFEKQAAVAAKEFAKRSKDDE